MGMPSDAIMLIHTPSSLVVHRPMPLPCRTVCHDIGLRFVRMCSCAEGAVLVALYVRCQPAIASG
jgi:hypothetical protein